MINLKDIFLNHYEERGVIMPKKTHTNKTSRAKKTSNIKRTKKRSSINSADEVPLNRDLPVTLGHFEAFRQEINSRIVTVELLVRASDEKNEVRFRKQDAKFVSIESRFKEIDARFETIDKRFIVLEENMNQRFQELEAKFEVRFSKLEAKVDRMLALIEEQNDRNKLVMDALMNLFNRQENLEKTVETRLKTIEDAIKGS